MKSDSIFSDSTIWCFRRSFCRIHEVAVLRSRSLTLTVSSRQTPPYATKNAESCAEARRLILRFTRKSPPTPSRPESATLAIIPKIVPAAHHDDLDIQLGFPIDGIEQSEKDEAQSCTPILQSVRPANPCISCAHGHSASELGGRQLNNQLSLVVYGREF